jgi:hypothetical protein
MRHACGKYHLIDLEPLAKYKEVETGLNYQERRGELVRVLQLLKKIPVVFGNHMRKRSRRNPNNICPRCKQKVPAGLITYVNTWRLRENEN